MMIDVKEINYLCTSHSLQNCYLTDKICMRTHAFEKKAKEKSLEHFPEEISFVAQHITRSRNFLHTCGRKHLTIERFSLRFGILVNYSSSVTALTAIMQCIHHPCVVAVVPLVPGARLDQYAITHRNFTRASTFPAGNRERKASGGEGGGSVGFDRRPGVRFVELEETIF